MNTPLAEGLKEIVRIAILAAIPVLIALMQNGEGNWKLVGVTVAVAVLRGIDSWIHDSDLPIKGLSPV